MNKSVHIFASARAIALCVISAWLLSACVSPLLTTDIKLGPNDTTAKVRFRFVGNGWLNILEHGSAACYAEADPAIRSLASITYQARSLNATTWLFSQPRLGMPNDLEDVSQLTYAEVVVKAGIPLVFSAHWSIGDRYRYYKAWRFLSFTPVTGADYEVVVTDDVKIPMSVTIARLQVDDGKIVRTPVEVTPPRICGTS
ncbi:hypothetical protein LGM42_24595 [Burkholderia sp. AU39826]|uniref:hypothetical protein n=1 Tax=Burkholderia sp. AU39826 TaxID=2879634 RepID=UPI001CF298AD|nr:hypothetical protein [Burkholderia sp. AU39826]MCA7973049.1 hypothetical protein [Burkholderia sp. AU39826]